MLASKKPNTTARSTRVKEAASDESDQVDERVNHRGGQEVKHLLIDLLL